MNKNELLNKIKGERDKAVKHCVSLENKKEQLFLLVRQLENLSYTREYNYKNLFNNESLQEIDYIKPANQVINLEISNALKAQNDISNDIKSLRNKIEKLNKSLSNKF